MSDYGTELLRRQLTGKVECHSLVVLLRHSTILSFFDLGEAARAIVFNAVGVGMPCSA